MDLNMLIITILNLRKHNLKKMKGRKHMKKLRKKNMSSFYTNIELNNKKFQEFAFATHPDAYNPKKNVRTTYF